MSTISASPLSLADAVTDLNGVAFGVTAKSIVAGAPATRALVATLLDGANRPAR